MPKVLSLARQIAHEEGIKPVSNETLEFIIWERTGYPCFWPTGNAVEDFTAQLHEAFKEMREHRKEAKDG